MQETSTCLTVALVGQIISFILYVPLLLTTNNNKPYLYSAFHAWPAALSASNTEITDIKGLNKKEKYNQ